MSEKIAERFARETAEHELTVLHDDGLYRHLRFQKPNRGAYWFDLITVPGVLIFRGDGDSFVFARIEDMFEFFRGPIGQINPQYWQEKLTDGHDRVMNYDQELLRQHVDEAVAEAVKDEADGLEEGAKPLLAGLADAVRWHVADELIGDESLDRDVVERFRFWADPDDEFKYPRPDPDFSFGETWEWTTRDYDWWFLWACQAIVWGIAYHDTGTRPAMPAPQDAEPAAPKPVKGRPVADVHLPELQEVSR